MKRKRVLVQEKADFGVAEVLGLGCILAVILFIDVALAADSPEKRGQSGKVSMEQLPERTAEKGLAINPIVYESGKRKMGVPQVPGDRALPEGQKAPEAGMVREVESPDARLLSQVTEVWYSLRTQGIQVTPELIAREIGPDALSQFLEQHPHAEELLSEELDQDVMEALKNGEIPLGQPVLKLPGS